LVGLCRSELATEVRFFLATGFKLRIRLNLPGVANVNAAIPPATIYNMFGMCVNLRESVCTICTGKNLFLVFRAMLVALSGGSAERNLSVNGRRRSEVQRSKNYESLLRSELCGTGRVPAGELVNGV